MRSWAQYGAFNFTALSHSVASFQFLPTVSVPLILMVIYFPLVLIGRIWVLGHSVQSLGPTPGHSDPFWISTIDDAVLF